MKKILVVCVALGFSLLYTNSTQAQGKIGVFDEQSVLGLMPGIEKVDTLLNQYVTDSLSVERDYELSELKRKDSTFKKDSATMNPSLRSIMQKEIGQHFYKLQNWQQYQQQMVQQKQDLLLRPYLEKVYNALQEVVAEQKYVYVFKADAFSPYAPPPLSDNLSIKVALKMGLKLPQNVLEALKAQGVSTGNGAGAAAPKPAVKKP